MATKFPKGRLVESDRFNARQDALNAVLKDGESYTIQEAEEALNKFYNGPQPKMKRSIPAYGDITTKEIKARLEGLKVDYSGVTVKKELYELLKQGGNE